MNSELIEKKPHGKERNVTLKIGKKSMQNVVHFRVQEGVTIYEQSGTLEGGLITLIVNKK